ncbi:MAG: 3-oxoacyl-[acyl-carrier-protein] synthase III C-terminal domain-containing protein [Chloroflexia bacterium]
MITASPSSPHLRYQNNHACVGLSHPAYSLPSARNTLAELEAHGKLLTPPAVLAEFGFERRYAVGESECVEDLMLASARSVLASPGVRPQDVGTLLWVSGLRDRPSPAAAGDDRSTCSATRRRARATSWGWPRPTPSRSRSRGAAELLSAIHIAASTLQSSERPSVLCVAGDALPPDARSEVMYNVMSDAGCAVLLEREAPRNRILSFHQRTQAHYWDTPEREQEILAAYFPMARRVIAAGVERAGLTLGEVDWFVPHNVSLRSWQILAGLLGVEVERVWTKNIARVGHTVSCDHVINLADMERQGVLRPGDKLALFTFGLGASWSCLVLEH